MLWLTAQNSCSCHDGTHCIWIQTCVSNPERHQDFQVFRSIAWFSFLAFWVLIVAVFVCFVAGLLISIKVSSRPGSTATCGDEFGQKRWWKRPVHSAVEDYWSRYVYVWCVDNGVSRVAWLQLTSVCFGSLPTLTIHVLFCLFLK